MRLSLLCALLAFLAGAGAVQAQEQERNARPDWEGVWEGTIGSYPVVACFDERYDGDGQGSYYYLSQLKPIRLRSQAPMQAWTEGDGEGDTGSDAVPGWEIAKVTPDALFGMWRAGERNLAIALTRIPADARDYDGHCSSLAYFAPRLAPAEFGRDARLLNGFHFVAQRYAPPEHFAGVIIQGFSFIQEQPGDAAILAWL